MCSRSNGRCVRCVASLWKQQLGLANMLLHSLGAVIVDLCCVLGINMLWFSSHEDAWVLNWLYLGHMPLPCTPMLL